LTLLFSAPAAGTCALERMTLPLPDTYSVGGAWTEVARATPTDPGVTTFEDAMLPSGALLRVRGGPYVLEDLEAQGTTR
jgi:hypothetical protein